MTIFFMKLGTIQIINYLKPSNLLELIGLVQLLLNPSACLEIIHKTNQVATGLFPGYR